VCITNPFGEVAHERGADAHGGRGGDVRQHVGGQEEVDGVGVRVEVRAHGVVHDHGEPVGAEVDGRAREPAHVLPDRPDVAELLVPELGGHLGGAEVEAGLPGPRRRRGCGRGSPRRGRARRAGTTPPPRTWRSAGTAAAPCRREEVLERGGEEEEQDGVPSASHGERAGGRAGLVGWLFGGRTASSACEFVVGGLHRLVNVS
jgi:hypothetical protein